MVINACVLWDIPDMTAQKRSTCARLLHAKTEALAKCLRINISAFARVDSQDLIVSTLSF
ncbi:hypothetical protein D918_07522 [Trichuris suis]|nr:hypothetical protein D918_07522 [Trichuris suis]